MQVVTYANRRLVRRHRGTMPIILTAPHGGSDTPPGVTARTSAATPAACTGGQRFNTSRDDRTRELTEAIAQRILDKTGLSPYVVIARFHRRFVDANRNRNCAFTDPAAGIFYDEYHNRIDGYLTQLLNQNNQRGFLFDIHGAGVQAGSDANLIISTATGGTLQQGYDRSELFRQHGFQGLLEWTRLPPLPGSSAKFRFEVFPQTNAQNDFPGLNGGQTVRTYGGRVNAIQIEVISTLRNEATRFAYTVEALANAMIHSVRRWAPF